MFSFKAQFRKSLPLLFLSVALLAPLSSQAGQQYSIDASHSDISFVVSHMAISKVRGTFNDYTASLQYDENDPTKTVVQLTIQAASVDTGDEKRDNHLRQPDFFNVAANPTLQFQSKEIVKNKDKKTRKTHPYVAKGDLLMNGVTQPIEIPFAFNGPIRDPWGNHRLGIEGGLTIDRKNWKIKFSKALDNGGLVVGDDVQINLAVQFIANKVDSGKAKDAKSGKKS